MTSRTSLKSYFTGLLLILGSLFFILLLLEGAARVFFPHDRDHVIPGRIFTMDSLLGWKLKPHKRIRHQTRYFDVIYATSSAGYRDVERDPDGKKDSYRILLYGDSQIFGWGVPVDERFSNRVAAGNDALEIWNFAVPAYGLDQQILSYQHNNVASEADEVVFFVSEATLRRTRSDFMYNKPKPVFEQSTQGVLRMVPPRQVEKTRLLYEMLNPFYLPYVVKRRLQVLRARWTKMQTSSTADPGAPTPQSSVREVEKAMLRLARDVAAQRGQKITILTYATKATERDLQEFCKREGIGFLDIEFGLPPTAVIFGEGDAHWTPVTHRMVAEQFIEQANWNSARGDLTER